MTRWITVGLLAALAAACGHVTSQYHVARGASGTFPYSSKGCSTDAAARVAVEDGRFFEARAPGRAEIECADDTYLFDVQEVARIAIQRSASGQDQAGYVAIELVAYDQSGRELYLGDHTEVVWEVPATLEQRGGCHGDIMPVCDPGYRIGVRPSAGGEHRVVARFAGRAASFDLDGPVARGPR